MTIQDEKLRRHFEKVVSVMTECPLDERPVCALLDAWQWFRVVDGEDSRQSVEAIEHLLSEEMRPALRKWYQRFGENMNPAAIAFRDRLGKLAGEAFG